MIMYCKRSAKWHEKKGTYNLSSHLIRCKLTFGILCLQFSHNGGCVRIFLLYFMNINEKKFFLDQELFMESWLKRFNRGLLFHRDIRYYCEVYFGDEKKLSVLNSHHGCKWWDVAYISYSYYFYFSFHIIYIYFFLCLYSIRIF